MSRVRRDRPRCRTTRLYMSVSPKSVQGEGAVISLQFVVLCFRLCHSRLAAQDTVFLAHFSWVLFILHVFIRYHHYIP